MFEYNDNDEFNVNDDDLLFLDDEFEQFLASLPTTVIVPELDDYEARLNESSQRVFDVICKASIENNRSFQDTVGWMMDNDPAEGNWPDYLIDALNKDVEVCQEQYPNHTIIDTMVGVILTTSIMSATGTMPDPFFPADLGHDGHYSL